ncbi:Ribokinase-like protein [Coprinopsis sp. MPI-PUGE-AT-0042]|nr:Ribokinase-like protein [Coprinopsis sp. MPI-PUGE-AT-0042]
MNPHFTTLGMFIIDDFSFADEQGNPTGKIGGGGTYAAIGARIWLQPSEIRMVIDRGYDFPSDIEQKLLKFGEEMWAFRDQPSAQTTRALNAYRGEHRGFEYTTPRIRITPKDLPPLGIEKPQTLHFICSPTRAAAIISEVKQVGGWSPLTIYEPIPDRCVPEELPALKKILHNIAILSPNAVEALSLLSMPSIETKDSIERAASSFLDFSIGEDGKGWVIIRSGAMGAYVRSRGRPGRWIEAYWTPEDEKRIVDVTGAGNAFLGGLAAGLKHAEGDVEEAVFYASVSASFIIEQQGLPTMEASSDTGDASWNADSPKERLRKLKERHPRTNDAE